MKFYYSGGEERGNPERVLGKQARVMFTYAEQIGRKLPEKRLRDIVTFRKKQQGNQGKKDANKD